MLDTKQIRNDFPILERTIWNNKPLVYFDNAATTQKPRVVIDALKEYYENYNANIHRGVHKLAEEATNAYENTRKTIKDFIGLTDNESVIFTRNTTESINLLAHCLGERFIKEGDEILITEMEHHSNIIPWYLLKDKKGVKIKFAPITENYDLDYNAFEKLVNKKTKVISITHKSNVLGTVNDMKKIKNVVKARLIAPLLIVDAAQSAPHMKIDFRDMGCDFIAFSSHKMCGPTGVGILAGKKELLEQFPPYMGGGEMIRKVTFDGFTTNDVPWKFEAGTPNIADVIAFNAAINYIEKIGLENIYEHEKKLTEYALKKLKEFGFLKIYNSGNGVGIVTFSNPLVHPHDIATIVDQYGVAIRAGHHCAQPLMNKLGLSATARASFYLYNTIEEVDIFIDALKNAFDYFKVGACKELNVEAGLKPA